MVRTRSTGTATWRPAARVPYVSEGVAVRCPDRFNPDSPAWEWDCEPETHATARGLVDALSSSTVFVAFTKSKKGKRVKRRPFLGYRSASERD